MSAREGAAHVAGTAQANRPRSRVGWIGTEPDWNLEGRLRGARRGCEHPLKEGGAYSVVEMGILSGSSITLRQPNSNRDMHVDACSKIATMHQNTTSPLF